MKVNDSTVKNMGLGPISLLMGTNTKANGSMAFGVDKEPCFTIMGPSSRVNGITTRQMVMENSPTRMVTCSLAAGKTVSPMAKAITSTEMEVSMRVDSSME